jgi:hypothetical protein
MEKHKKEGLSALLKFLDYVSKNKVSLDLCF